MIQFFSLKNIISKEKINSNLKDTLPIQFFLKDTSSNFEFKYKEKKYLTVLILNINKSQLILLY